MKSQKQQVQYPEQNLLGFMTEKEHPHQSSESATQSSYYKQDSFWDTRALIDGQMFVKSIQSKSDDAYPEQDWED